MRTILDYISGLLMPVVPVLGVVLAASMFYSVVFDAPVSYQNRPVEGQPIHTTYMSRPSDLRATEQRLDIAMRQLR